MIKIFVKADHIQCQRNRKKNESVHGRRKYISLSMKREKNSRFKERNRRKNSTYFAYKRLSFKSFLDRQIGMAKKENIFDFLRIIIIRRRMIIMSSIRQMKNSINPLKHSVSGAATLTQNSQLLKHPRNLK